MSKTRTLKAKTDILILTDSGGHSVAAHALEAAFSALQPSLQITTINFSEQMLGPQLNSHIHRIFHAANRYVPTFFRWYYKGVDKILSMPQLRNQAASFACASLQRYLDADPPRLIIATHPVPAGAVGEMKRRGLYSGATTTIITDHYVHRRSADCRKVTL